MRLPPLPSLYKSTLFRSILTVGPILEALVAEEEDDFRGSLTPEERLIRDRRIPRPALLFPVESPFQRALESGNDQAMITLTGLGCHPFMELHAKFKPMFETHSPNGPDGLRLLLLVL
jgi:hypothetical protein